MCLAVPVVQAASGAVGSSFPSRDNLDSVLPNDSLRSSSVCGRNARPTHGAETVPASGACGISNAQTTPAEEVEFERSRQLAGESEKPHQPLHTVSRDTGESAQFASDGMVLTSSAYGIPSVPIATAEAAELESPTELACESVLLPVVEAPVEDVALTADSSREVTCMRRARVEQLKANQRARRLEPREGAQQRSGHVAGTAAHDGQTLDDGLDTCSVKEHIRTRRLRVAEPAQFRLAGRRFLSAGR